MMAVRAIILSPLDDENLLDDGCKPQRKTLPFALSCEL